MKKIFEKYGKPLLRALVIALLGGTGGVASYQFMQEERITTEPVETTVDEWRVWYRAHSNTLTDRFVGVVTLRGDEPTKEFVDSIGKVFNLPMTYHYEEFLFAEKTGETVVPPVEPIETDSI